MCSDSENDMTLWTLSLRSLFFFLFFFTSHIKHAEVGNDIVTTCNLLQTPHICGGANSSETGGGDCITERKTIFLKT